jgi:hypothetical protein
MKDFFGTALKIGDKIAFNVPGYKKLDERNNHRFHAKTSQN